MLFSPNKNIRIVLTGGGSGGHVFPVISVLHEIQKYIPEFERQGLSIELIYFGPDDFTLDFVKKENISIRIIKSGRKVKNIFNIFIGFFQAFWNLFILMPDAIFGKGGFATVPTLLVGTIFGIPIFIHESDSIPGMVNKFFSRFAVKTFISFERSADYFLRKDKLILTGNPIREFLNTGDLQTIDQNKTKKLLGLQTKKPVLLVLGGSQGAQTVNDLILDALTQLLNKFEIIHQTGTLNIDSVKREVEIIFREYNVEKKLQELYHPISFLEESNIPSITSLKDCMIACDVILTRSGSNSIFEIASFGKPSVLIPLPWASQDHQTVNAFSYAQGGRALVLEQGNLKPNILCETLEHLTDDKQKMEEMSLKALEFAKRDSSANISKTILQYILNKF